MYLLKLPKLQPNVESSYHNDVINLPEKNGDRDRRKYGSKMAAAILSRDLVFENESTEDFQTFDEHFMLLFFCVYKLTLSEIVCFLSGVVTI